MDPLSDLLSRLKPRSSVSAGFDAGGDWAVSFANPEERIKCYAVVSGFCWMVVDGLEAPLPLCAGDAFVLPGGRDFRLASDPAWPAVDAMTLFPPRQAGGTVRINGGGGVYLVGSRFVVGGAQSALMLGMLPAVIHLRPQDGAAALRGLVETMMQELADARPGADLMAQHLAHMMLIRILRLHLDQGRLPVRPGWFGALSDPRLHRALAALHGDPARRWSVASLAQAAGMSRSSFAEAFRSRSGETPMDYLTRWRMFLALEPLESGRLPLAEIAERLGYASESSFSTAFKRVMGGPPRAFAQGQSA